MRKKSVRPRSTRTIWHVLDEIHGYLVELREILDPLLLSAELFAPYEPPPPAKSSESPESGTLHERRAAVVRRKPRAPKAEAPVMAAPEPSPVAVPTPDPVVEPTGEAQVLEADRAEEVPRSPMPTSLRGQLGLLQSLTKRLPRGLRNEVLVIRHRQGAPAAIRRAEEMAWAEKLLRDAAARSSRSAPLAAPPTHEKARSFDDLLAQVER